MQVSVNQAYRLVNGEQRVPGKESSVYTSALGIPRA